MWNGFWGAALSQRELPLWARAVAAALLLFASWWLLETETLRGLMGYAIAPLSLGVVAAFILRGMHLPLGLWPNGPWRERFSIGTVVVVAAVFAVLILAARPYRLPELAAALEPGMAVIIVAGVVAWGFAWAFVHQRRFLPWYGAAAAAALMPFLLAVFAVLVRAGPGFCVLSTVGPEGATCGATIIEALVFLTAVGSAAALVTTELAFRRLLVGHPDRAGLVLVLGAALIASLWSLLVAVDSRLFEAPWWLAGLAATGAGSLYVLSGSLLVSALYSGLVFAGFEALRVATPTVEGAQGAVVGWEYLAAHAIAVVLLCLLVARRKGILRGIV